jgi:geranylgeranyl diphosphate synthase type I
MGFFDELGKVSDIVTKVIREDDFPVAVEPDCLREAVRDYPLRGGKRLRPALTLWTCGALGGDERKALRAAAAAEIYHNWTLVHDDIIDNDDTRRLAPTCHRSLARHAGAAYRRGGEASEKFGRDMAILAGDIQQAWAVRMLLRSADDGMRPELAAALAARLQDKVCRLLISGEALDVEFPMRDFDTLSLPEVERMLRMKTGVLLEFCAEAGAAAALDSADFDGSPDIRAAAEFAAQTGLAFQLKDDLLGVFGEGAKLGKDMLSDFSESKPTVLLLKALELSDERGKSRIKGMLGRPSHTDAEALEIRALLRDCGAEAYVADRIKDCVGRAKAKLDVFPDNPRRKLLLELADFAASREK